MMNEVIKMRHYERMTFVPQIIHLDFIQEVQEVAGSFHFFCRSFNCFSCHLPLLYEGRNIPELIFFVYELREFGI